MPIACSKVVRSRSARITLQKSLPVKRFAEKVIIQTERSAKRLYTTVAETDEAKEARQIQNAAPVQPTKLTVENVNDLTPEYEHLRQYLPVVVVDEELALVEGRVNQVKKAGKKPSAADLTTLLLVKLKKNDLDGATVTWHELLGLTTPDILHWNLMLVHSAKARKFGLVEEIYEHFKLAVIKRRLPGPVPVTYNVVLKAFSERGDIEHVMEIYEDFFNNGWIPELYHIRSVVKAAALAGDAKLFQRFSSRLAHKGVTLDREIVKGHIDVFGRHQANAELLKKKNPTTGDYASVIGLALRVRNYRKAYDLINDGRERLGLQPDARMYETVLEAMVRDGYQRERARALKKRFHKYPKGIEVREEHFEFNQLFEQVLAELGEKASDAPIKDLGERIKFARTTRKQSRQLYNGKPAERYVSGWESDDFEWVPEYVQRKKDLAMAKEQAAKAAELDDIIQKAKKQASASSL